VPKPGIEDQTLLTLGYWREYRAMLHLGIWRVISEASVSRIVARLEDISTESKEFALPGKRRVNLSPEIDATVADVVKSPIEHRKSAF